MQIQPPHSNKTILLILLCLIVTLLCGLWLASTFQRRHNLETLSNELLHNRRTLSLGSNEHILGNPDARIVLVEYFDLECPHCKRFHAERSRLRQIYASEDVAFVYRNFPLTELHNRAFNEAVALECVASLKGEDAYHNYTHMIYEHTESNDSLDPTLLYTFAGVLGIPDETLAGCVADGRAAQKVKDDMLRGTLDGIASTPSFQIYRDGELVSTISAQATGIEWKTLFLTLDALVKNK